MKKIMALVCALSLAGGAMAQVVPTRNVGMPQTQELKRDASVVEFTNNMQAKADIEVDTIWSQPLYQYEELYITFSWTGGVPAEQLGQTASVFLPLGTGWMNYYYGGGELGYYFPTGGDVFYDKILRKGVYEMFVTGAMTEVARIHSTSSKITATDSMPVYFKAYTNDYVVSQDVYTDITTGQGKIDIATLPLDPTKYASVSEVVKVAQMPARQGASGGYFPGSVLASAKFETPARAGDNLCVSIVFPNDGAETDTLWNATLFGLSLGNNNTVTSEWPHAMFTVLDFDKQMMFIDPETKEVLRKKTEGFVPETSPQTSDRYAVIPLDNWVWQKDGSHLDYEAAFRVSFASAVDIASPNPIDKYVEVAPVPAVDNVTIKSIDRVSRIDIYTLNGGLVKSMVCNGNIVDMSVSGLQSGMYIAKVTTDGGIATKKIVVR